MAAYLSDHYAAEIPMERLTQIACMGTTKLKSSFKKVYDCTITEYIQQRRMSQAEYLLTNTDLSIGQIAQTVGYSTSSRFAELFRKSTGLLPGEFRKVGKPVIGHEKGTGCRPLMGGIQFLSIFHSPIACYEYLFYSLHPPPS